MGNKACKMCNSSKLIKHDFNSDYTNKYRKIECKSCGYWEIRSYDGRIIQTSESKSMDNTPPISDSKAEEICEGLVHSIEVLKKEQALRELKVANGFGTEEDVEYINATKKVLGFVDFCVYRFMKWFGN